MRRPSKTGGEQAKTRRHKTAARKRGNALKVRGRGSPARDKETEIAQIIRERDQALEQLSEALEQQTATSEVLDIISTSPGELEPVFNSILQNATRICEANFGNLLLYDGELFHRVALHNAPAAWAADQLRDPRRTREQAPLLYRLLDTREVVHVTDVTADVPGDTIHKFTGARTIVLVPMLKGGELVGGIGVYRQEVRPFTDKQIELVKNFAAQAVIAIENTRLVGELRESLQQQTATADVLKIVSRSTFDLQSVLDTLVQSAVQLCDAECAHIFQFTDEGYRLAACCGYSREYEDYMRAQRIVPGRHTLIGRVAIEGGVVHISDVLADAEYQWAEAQKLGRWRTMLGVPLLREGSPIGALSLTRSTVKPFTEKQIELLTTFADQAVIAIENVRLFEAEQQRTRELRESLEQQTATSEVLSVISSSPGDMKPVFEAILANALRICEAKFGHILLYDGERYHASHLHDVPPSYRQFWEQHGPIRPGPNTGLARLARTKQIAHIPDLKADPVYAEREPLRVITVDQAGARTLLAVPMVKDDQLIGAIIIYRQEVQPFADEQIELVKNFAAQAVIAIENTRLLNELRQSLQQQTATADVLKVISRSAFDLKHVFETVAESAVKLCDADKAFIFRFDGELLHAIVAFNASQELRGFLESNPIRPGRYSGAGRAALERRTIHIPDVLVDPEYTYGSRDVDLVRTVLTVPMLKGDDLLGVILIYRLEVKPFTDNQISLIETFADQAAIAVENVRLLSELRESLQQQTATADVLKVISRSTFDLQTVLQTLVESAARLCDADKVNITRQRDGIFYRAEAYGFSPEFMDYVRNIPIQAERGSAFGRALLEGRAAHIPDVKADPEYTLVEGQRLGDYRTVLAVPMLREGVPTGVLSLTRSEVRPFTEKQIELASTFADQAAIAIENVRLFENVEARTRELANSLENLRTTQDRLVQTEKLASLGQLTAGIAHEIKNPLNFVNNFSGVSVELIDELQDVLKSGKFDDKARADVSDLAETLRSNLDKIVQHGKRADSIVKNMLLHSREGSGERRSVDVNAIVEESLNLAYHGARAEKQGFNVTLQRSFDPTAGEAEVFPQEIIRVLLNLISNGFYAATRRQGQESGNGFEPTITAATKSLGDRVEIRVRDNGIGIPPEVREKMFNPFFTTKPAGEGTGLGLSISHDIIVKQHSGSIEVDTKPGAFTEFRIILPRTAA